VRAAREDWFAGQLDLDPERLVVLDETAAPTSMARRYGWAPRGERCPGGALDNHHRHRRAAHDWVERDRSPGRPHDR
jgi:hypothetical protein